MIAFINVLTVAVGILSLIVLINTLRESAKYPNSIQEIHDMINGARRVFYPERPFIVFVVCLCWIISRMV